VLLDVDHDGACVEDLDAAGDVGAVVLTPNRQHPTGATLSAPRRTRLLDWARANDVVVVEDDYDGEFRYDGRPISPLQGLAPDVVVYAGTASKTLAPGVRLGWLALPGALRAAVIAEKQHTDGLTGALDQMAFAELLRTNAYDRHIRRMRLRYRRRRDALVSALAAAHPRLRITGGSAGLNVVIPLPDADVEAGVLDAARAAGIGVDGLAHGGYYETRGPAGVVVGYAAPPEHDFRHAVHALAGALRACSTSPPHVGWPCG
jgi:GntR family transcriptional regulator / MocR family aminotransferase